MFNLIRRDDFDSLQDVDRIFADFFNGFDSIHVTRALLNAYQTDAEVIIELYVPNIDSKNIDISIEEGVLKIEGNSLKDDETRDKHYYRREFVSKSFVRSVVLPVEVKEDEVKAEYKNGMLKIVLPKKEAKKATQVKVKVE